MEDVVIILLLVAVQGVSYWFKKKREAEEELLAEKADAESADPTVSLPAEEVIASRQEIAREKPQEELVIDLNLAYQEFLKKQEELKEDDKKLEKKTKGFDRNKDYSKPRSTDLKKAVIWAEILGPCRAHKGQRSQV